MSTLQGMTILIVEDERKIADVVQAYLEKEKCWVVTAFDGLEAMAIINKSHLDLIILDIMLPEIDGIEILKKVKEKSDTPVIMLTAKSEEVDKIVGLELGADDYVSKPFSPRELVARVKAVLRRRQSTEEDEKTIKQGKIEINLDRHEVIVRGESTHLTATEFNILKALARKPGRVFSRLQLAEIAQGYTFEGYERTIDAHIKNIRHKIEKDPSKPQHIKTVFGVGYKFEVP